uniref:Uncharacterized protein n=1 Tax=Arundo donax TaxID=35708 RepID=A0A0A9E303_ARUDO
MVLLPLGRRKVLWKQLRCNWHNCVSANGDGKAVKALLCHSIVVPFTCIFIFSFSRVPSRVIFNIKQHLHEHCKQPANKLWELSHHSWCTLPSLSKSNHKLYCQVPGPIF